MIAAAAVVAAVYFAKDFLFPLALAALFGFMLNPLVHWLEHRRVPRTVGVTAVAVALLAALALIGWLLANEIAGLVASLPDFRANLVEKLRALRGPVRTLADALGWIDRLSKEIEPAGGAGGQAPKVEVVQPPTAIGVLGRFVTPLLEVLGTAGIVAILAVFILAQSDLPKRISALFALRGSRISPRALGEAGELVSGFLVRQAFVCVVQGVVVTTALALIGVPGALVFGSLSALLRSIPYFGPTTAAALPIAFCLAAFRGFGMALWTSGFFVCWELFTNNVLDPRVLGPGAGLSPFGVILAATFWAWLWGPPGLFVAIPLTACLIVLGRYVPQLAFVPALLGKDVVMSPAGQLLERLLAGEADEAASLLRQDLKEGDLVELSDQRVLPMLARLADEREAGRCTRADQVRSLHLLRDLLAELVATVPVAAGAAPSRTLSVEELRGSFVDRFARDWVATVLERAGFAVAPAREPAPLVVFAVAGDRGVEGALRAAGTAARLRGREGVVIVATVEPPGAARASGVTVVRSCAALVAALAPAPIARGEAAREPLELAEAGRAAAP